LTLVFLHKQKLFELFFEEAVRVVVFLKVSEGAVAELVLLLVVLSEAGLAGGIEVE